MKNGEYLEKGDYHKNLDKNWPFYPVYLEKMRLVESFLDERGKSEKILDLGCGEGVLVSKFRNKGYDIIGVDANYESRVVFKRDILATGFDANSFDIILCLDVLEHLDFESQGKALVEINRILKPGGLLILTVPNLAHFASRISFLFLGRLIRTAIAMERHKGDRTAVEYLKMIEKNKFFIKKRKGLFPTFPFVSFFTYYFPSKIVWWHKILNKFFAWPNWCFLNFLVCENKKDD